MGNGFCLSSYYNSPGWDMTNHRSLKDPMLIVGPTVLFVNFGRRGVTGQLNLTSAFVITAIIIRNCGPENS